MANSPAFNSRVDDIYMVNTQVGYAVSGDGRIVKSTDGGENWLELLQNTSVYCRSVEFVSTQKGFVGAFPLSSNTNYINILRRTTDGGLTWIDLSDQLHPRARRGGICGLAAPDSNTIYGGGNWFRDSAYIIKSTDGGNTWNFIDMTSYATSIIDFHFISKDTGFATGKGLLPIESAVILYTTNGGESWATIFENYIPNEYCWKIQRLTKLIWFASIEDLTSVPPRILKSLDGGMTWKEYEVAITPYNIEGIGFIDPLHGWTGGGSGWSFESRDGGKTWDTTGVCPLMNRVFKVNDTMMFASGRRIWKYRGLGIYPIIPDKRFAWMKLHPNPVNDQLTINISIDVSTQVLVLLLDGLGRRVKVIDNTTRPKGSYHFYCNTSSLPPGIYYVVLKTHEDKKIEKIVVGH
jgi:photosystem II stability/assembly factor-like uncharacterized protein